MVLTEVASGIVQNKLPPKLKYLDTRLIPCATKNRKIKSTLSDLETFVNHIPLSLYRKLELRDMI